VSASGGSASGLLAFRDPDWHPDGHSVDFVPRDPDSHGFIFGGTNVETGRGEGGTVVWNYSTSFGTGTLMAGQHDIFDVILRDNSGATATHTLDFLLV
jgi:hypothetical protein